MTNAQGDNTVDTKIDVNSDVTDVNDNSDSVSRQGPWNPGLESSIPSNLLPLSTLYRAENVTTSLSDAQELSDFCGLATHELVAFNPERLVVHETLVRVTADLTVPDGPRYEDLGIHLRGMVETICERYVKPHLAAIAQQHSNCRQQAEAIIQSRLETVTGGSQTAQRATVPSKRSWLLRLISRSTPAAPASAFAHEQRQQRALRTLKNDADIESDPLTRACLAALVYIVDAVIRHRGRLVGNGSMITRLAVDRVSNLYGSDVVGQQIESHIARAVKEQGYRVLPRAETPVVMNVKGASAAGKSTIRPQQQKLAETLGIPWEDFAVISPDYWRKYLLDYHSLGKHYKYAAMLTGHELAIIDQKLDRYMADKASRQQVSHLLIDRFRFDSFTVTDDLDINSTLLTRFGERIFMFFIITPPEMTVERAWDRGKTTGRYKAVDDLIYHNIEAYNGIPSLFFTWAASTNKHVHYEFLDNSVHKGSRPRTVAFGSNKTITILDIKSLLNIERFKQINVDAKSEAELYDAPSLDAQQHLGFLSECCRRMRTVNFVNPDTGKLFGQLQQSQWVLVDKPAAGSLLMEEAITRCLTALGWDSTDAMVATANDSGTQTANAQFDQVDHLERRYLLGAWPE